MRPRVRRCEALTGTNERVGDKDLLRLASGRRGRSGAVVAAAATGGSSRRGTTGVMRGVRRLRLLTVRAGAAGGARVALLVVEKDGADVVDGNVNGVGDTGNGQNALWISVACSTQCSPPWTKEA